MKHASLSIANPAPLMTSLRHKIALAAAVLGGLLLVVVWASGQAPAAWWLLFLSLSLFGLGLGLYVKETYFGQPAGVRHHLLWFKSITARGVWAWVLGVLFTGFYVCLYWFPQYLQGLIRLFDPLSRVFRNTAADQWFVYGSLYTLALLYMGVRFIAKYRYNRYQVIRTISVMFFQFGFAWMLPGLLLRLQQPELYFTYFWPLNYFYGTPNAHDYFTGTGNLGTFFFFFGLVMFFVASPILTYFYGKRWYCSWVCGCGGLAETAGDPFRHLSDKSLGAWKLERWMIHSVLVFVTVTTALLWINAFNGRFLFGGASETLYKTYAFLVGSVFSGVVGVGFYPLLGSRVWCRFGCPMAAWLGIWQKKKSKFRITVNGGQCISCGNCSSFCEMGIDVRQYAQRGQDVVRASCVGCGLCAAVCPRGVLRLENAAEDVGQRAQSVRNGGE